MRIIPTGGTYAAHMKGRDIMKWFKGCTTAEAVKKMYRDLCKAYHPDLHPGAENEEKMKQINAEYDVAWARYKNVHGTAGTSEGNSTASAESGAESRREADEAPEEFKAVINSIIGCDGIEIDLVGSWVWVTGNTYPHRETIKSAGFKWANKKHAWYWHPAEEGARRHSKMSLDQIKERYGCESFATKAQPKLA